MARLADFDFTACPQCNGQGYYGVHVPLSETHGLYPTVKSVIRMRICTLCRGDGHIWRRLKADAVALQRVNEYNAEHLPWVKSSHLRL